MKAIKKSYLLASSLALMASMCGPSDPNTAPTRSTLKIVLVDSLAVEYDDNARHLPESIRNLCALLVSDTKDCNQTYILDPSILRVDLGDEFSLKTTIEKGGAKDVTKPKVIGKLIQKNFDVLEVPKKFTTRQATGKNIEKLLIDFVSNKSPKDSILVLSSTGSLDNKYSVNSKAYRVFTDIDEVRERMLNIMCQNAKANFTILVDPPQIEPIRVSGIGTPKPGTKVVSELSVSNGINQGHSKRKLTANRLQLSNSDLTIIKGSEGCDICTRYYSATDNLGRTHEVREKNSINCCPCGKTIEMNGRTYRMDCQGSPHLGLM